MNVIILIGFPRSGTTILFEALSAHPELAWFSNLLEKKPKIPLLAVLSRVANFPILRGEKSQLIRYSRIKKYLPYPTECYSVWNTYTANNFSKSYLIGKRASSSEKERIKKYIEEIAFFQGKKHFAIKLTGPTRITYLNSIFPNAKFIYIIRDPKAVISSLLKVNFWKKNMGYSEPWWEGGLIQDDLDTIKKYDRSAVAIAAVQWKRIYMHYCYEKSTVEKNRVLELSYEDFTSNPEKIIMDMISFSGIDSTKNQSISYIKKRKIIDQNFKYRESLSVDDIDIINKIIGNIYNKYIE